MITASGVFNACARLPTCVRARSRMVRFAVEQEVDLLSERRDVEREITLQRIRVASPDGLHLARQA